MYFNFYNLAISRDFLFVFDEYILALKICEFLRAKKFKYNF